jgi:hypothetical protein
MGKSMERGRERNHLRVHGFLEKCPLQNEERSRAKRWGIEGKQRGTMKSLACVHEFLKKSPLQNIVNWSDESKFRAFRDSSRR